MPHPILPIFHHLIRQALDFGTPGSRDWSLADDDPRNANLDGFNRFPDGALLPNFRTTMVDYYTQLESLSTSIAALMASGLHTLSHTLTPPYPTPYPTP